VGRGGSSTISSGKLSGGADDPGGKSYGTFQFASKRGIGGSSVKAFVQRYYADDFQEPDPARPGRHKPMEPGTQTFDKKWGQVAKDESDLFRNNEHEFIYDTHFGPVADAVKSATGLDIATRSDALKNVLWSVAVQHGPPSDPKASAVALITRALSKWAKEDLTNKPTTDGKNGVKDDDLIKAIYDERGKKKEDGKMFYFPKADLSKRFKRERADALAAHAKEQSLADPPDLNKTALGQLSRNLGLIAAPVRVKPKELFVERGQRSFDFSGYDRDSERTREPSVPNRRSGVHIGRGYDLGRISKGQIEKDLRDVGLSERQVQAYAGAAGLRGDKAYEYLRSLNYSRFSTEARDLGLKGADMAAYIRECIPQRISLAQQKRLFEISYDRAEKNARGLFSNYDKLPKSAQPAVVDMVFDLGPEDLATKLPEFTKAVRDQRLEDAAGASKRNGAGALRNEATRQALLGLGPF
jgi:hypothetical protein